MDSGTATPNMGGGTLQTPFYSPKPHPANADLALFFRPICTMILLGVLLSDDKIALKWLNHKIAVTGRGQAGWARLMKGSQLGDRRCAGRFATAERTRFYR